MSSVEFLQTAGGRANEQLPLDGGIVEQLLAAPLTNNN
jgi:hypothetical protein